MEKIKKKEPLEATIVKNITKAINAIPGHFVEKRHGSQFAQAGNPDLTGIASGGKRIEIEVKRPSRAVEHEDLTKPEHFRAYIKAGATDIQAKRLHHWHQFGALTGVAHSVEEALEIIGQA